MIDVTALCLHLQLSGPLVPGGMIQVRYELLLLRCAVGIAIGDLSGVAAATPQALNTVQRDITPDVARCIIRRENPLVERWLATAPDTQAEIDLFEHSQPRFDACFGGLHNPLAAGGWMIEYNRPGIRSGLIRAKLQERRESFPDVVPVSSTPNSWYSSGADTSADASERTATLMAAMSACLVLKHWQDVRTLVLAVNWKRERDHFGPSWTKLMARREAETVQPALGRVVPSISGCVPQGVTVRLDRVRLRAMLEEAAYHMIQAR